MSSTKLVRGVSGNIIVALLLLNPLKKFFKQGQNKYKFGESVNSAVGLLGAFILAIGGAFLFEGLYAISEGYYEINGGEPPFLGFIGFLFSGIGLWLIVLSGKSET